MIKKFPVNYHLAGESSDLRLPKSSSTRRFNLRRNIIKSGVHNMFRAKVNDVL